MRNRLQGVVVSDKMQRTVVVQVQRRKEHPRYKKRIKVHKKFKAHDENEECKEGDSVIIEECKPKSKDKRWKVAKRIEVKNEEESSQKEKASK